ncbi:chorismate-binding protein [Croceitalea sp. MTPC9]|uniref:chorismate-binding protein n=1 Tax=unclassified Croceitalea TaxID=2632280 RepID=UPI002B3D2019|nr:chorismate-binding protein [Croceitalea sp. MTPC6]GMN15900.1 chorismate-binding protein [Croceitalea sp. MTPC9]
MPSQENKEFKELLSKASKSKKDGLPFVLYRKPNSKTVNAIFPAKNKVEYTLDFSKTGFVFSPFDTSKKALLFLSNEVLKVAYQAENNQVNTKFEPIEKGKEQHLKLIDDAVSLFTAGPLKKIVLSRKIITETKKTDFEIFQLLLNTYPSAFNYILFHPKLGTWLGATPETLLRLDNSILTTISLAGTLPIVGDKPPDWGSKELQEQQMVTDYLKEVLSEKISKSTVTPVTSVKAGKLWHLKSVITGELKREISLTDVIEALHPTPAICGVPKELSKKFILDNENYDREYYTGFLGELNYNRGKQTQLFVNLRCMKLDSTKASIYVGGGVTQQSTAKNEWEETQHKSRTMLSLL